MLRTFAVLAMCAALMGLRSSDGIFVVIVKLVHAPQCQQIEGDPFVGVLVHAYQEGGEKLEGVTDERGKVGFAFPDVATGKTVVIHPDVAWANEHIHCENRWIYRVENSGVTEHLLIEAG